MIEFHSVDQGSDDWHKAREGKYTGSNAYKLLGSNGATEYNRAVQTDFTGNFHTERGHALEPQAVKLYERIQNVKVETTGYITNDKYPDCLYSPDGMVVEWIQFDEGVEITSDNPGLIEVKCFSIEKHMQLVRGDVPLKIKAQGHYGLFISEFKWFDLVAFNPSKELDVKDRFKIIRFHRNPAIHANFTKIITKGVTA